MDKQFIRSHLQFDSEHLLGAEDAMPQSCGYENIVTVKDVLSIYQPTTSQNAKTTEKFTINIMTKHALLSTTIISDKWSAFVSQMIEEVAKNPLITLKDATTEDAQTFGMLGWTQALTKKAIKSETS